MDALDDVALSETELQPGRIKWFDRAKGFGCANVFGKSDDIFVHIDVLRRCGLSGLVAGIGSALRVVAGERGLMAVSILSWEAAQVE
jgi:CspA family cold shock protein